MEIYFALAGVGWPHSNGAMSDDLTTQALKALRRILRAADLGTRSLAAATGLSPSQLLVLQEIDRRGETTPGALSAALQFGQATITNIVDRLEAAALVTRQRSSRDKRQILLAATETGRATIERAPICFKRASTRASTASRSGSGR